MSALTLSGRLRHSRGELARAEADLQQAVRSPVAGVRGTGEVWLGSLRMHQGRFEEALEHASRGAVDAAAMRHPFVIPHAMFARVYALGCHRSGRRSARCAARVRRARRRPGPGRRSVPPGGRQLLGLDPERDRSHGRGARAEPASHGHCRPVLRATAPRAVRSGARRGRSRGRGDRSLVARPGGGPARRSRRDGLAPAPPPAPPGGAGRADRGRPRHGRRPRRVGAIRRRPAVAHRGPPSRPRWSSTSRRPRAGRSTTRPSTTPSPASTASRGWRRGATSPAWRPPPVAPTSGREPSATPSSWRWPAAPTPTASEPGPPSRARNVCAAKRRDAALTAHRRRAVRMIMRRTSGSGCGPRRSRARASTRRRATSGSDVTKGATCAMPIRQATRSAGERSG